MVSVGSVLFVHLNDLEGDKAERYLLGWEQILPILEGNVAVALPICPGFNSDAPVAQLVEHRAVTWEVVSSTQAGPTLRVLK